LSGRRGHGRRSAIALAALLAASAAHGQNPRYLQRLSLPVAGDRIGYGYCVTADLHTGEVFVCDTRNSRILIFDRDGYFSHQIVGSVELVAPEDVAVDPNGLLVVLATRGGRRLPIELDFDGLFRREVPLAGLPAGSAEPNLTSIALSPDGERLYAADTANHQLWVADRHGLVLAASDLATGLSESDVKNLTLGHVDAYGDRVLVAMTSLGQIWLYSRDGERLATVGQKGVSPCQLARPTAAALGDDGNLLVVDMQRMLLLRWSVRNNRCLSEHIGIGDAPGFLYYPFDVALDTRGRLYIAQSYEGRVQVYDKLAPAAAPPGRDAPNPTITERTP
jgi:DNA-binding beta-propeller fold protein YncE